MKRRIIASLRVASAIVLLPLAPAHAAFGGANGLFAYSDWDAAQDSADIFVVHPDGTGQTNLTHTSGAHELEPAWSPDGSQIAFARRGEGGFTADIWVMDADGSNPRQVTFGMDAVKPAWSPDGMRLAFGYGGSGGVGVADANDGSNVMRLVSGNADDPRWSPDGQRIVYWSAVSGSIDIHSMRPDGTDQQRLTLFAGSASGADWSPDGSRIVFSANMGEDYPEVFIMDADGSYLTQVSQRPDLYDVNPVWSPDGSRIAWESCGGSDASGNRYSALVSAALDGSDLVEVTRLSQCTGAYPDWQAIQRGPAVKTVGIDIQPWDARNRVSLGTWSIVAVAYLSDPSFDATTIDTATACLGDAESADERTCGSLYGLELTLDVDSDGDNDQVLFFRARPSGIDAADQTACASATTVDGLSVRGCDRVWVR